jgi:hypothetical protein
MVAVMIIFAVSTNPIETRAAPGTPIGPTLTTDYCIPTPPAPDDVVFASVRNPICSI